MLVSPVKTGRSDMQVCLFVFVSWMLVATSAQGDRCHFAGLTYEVGETWHPFLHPFGMMTCINCTCLQDGDVKCVNQPCPKVTCKNPQMLEGTCCPQCLDNVPPVHPGPEVPVPAPGYKYRSCRHDEETFQHSQVFTSQSTALKPTKHNQCVLCICLDGEVLCHLKTCADLSCQERVLPDDDCCPSCKEEIEANGVGEVDSHLPFDFIHGNGTIHMVTQKQGTADCRVGNRIYKSDETWNPIIGPFGPMDCVVCSCREGRVMCERLQCTPPEDLPCSKPRFVAGRCCQVCPQEGKNGRKRKRERKKKRKQHLNSSKSTESSATSVRACPVSSNEAITFYSHSHDKVSRHLHNYTLVFEMRKKGIEIHRFQVNKGIITGYSPESLPLSRYQDIFQADNQQFSVIGMLRKRKAIRFGRRVQKTLTKCKPQCKKKYIKKLIKGLKLKALEFDYKNC